MHLLLTWPQHAPRADCRDHGAFDDGSQRGTSADVVRLLLGWPLHAPQADCPNCRALFQAVFGGHHEGVMGHLLLEWPQQKHLIVKMVRL